MYATLGKISELQIPAAINQALLALVPKSTIDKDYMKYALMAMRDYVLSASNSNTQDNLNAEIVSHFKIPVPPFSHQKKIGQVLKKKCSGIDAIIDNLSIFITLLYECKQAIISEVITRGLDPNVTLKDSGIPWLGMISDSWDVTRLKYLVTTSTTKSSSYSAYLGLENVESWTGRYIDTGAISSREESVTIKTGNLCFSKLRPYLAKAIIAPFDGACSSEFIVFDHFKGDIRYLKYLMLTPNFIEEVNSSTYGTKMPRASWDFISSMYVPNVPIDEQIQISDYLDRVCNIIDSIVDSVKYSIIQIQQYKQSLVYEYVTGKRLVDVEVS